MRLWHNADLDASAHCYLQQRIDGVSVAALYVASPGNARLLGVTRQLIGCSWCGLTEGAAHRFRYYGSIGPLQLAPPLETRFEQLGNVLAAAFTLQGLFGVDAILANDEIWPVEVNPQLHGLGRNLGTGAGHPFDRAARCRLRRRRPTVSAKCPAGKRAAALLRQDNSVCPQRCNRRAGIPRVVHEPKPRPPLAGNRGYSGVGNNRPRRPAHCHRVCRRSR